MKKESVYLSLGSNYPNAQEFLREARIRIGQLAKVRIASDSAIYYTQPQDYRNQPWFYNQVLELRVVKTQPDDLMRALLDIESGLGRVRNGVRFGPRPIDIDLLIFGQRIQNTQICILPHPRITVRAFVLVPLREIAPELCIYGKTPSLWLANLNWRQDGQKLYQY